MEQKNVIPEVKTEDHLSDSVDHMGKTLKEAMGLKKSADEKIYTRHQAIVFCVILLMLWFVTMISMVVVTRDALHRIQTVVEHQNDRVDKAVGRMDTIKDDIDKKLNLEEAFNGDWN